MLIDLIWSYQVQSLKNPHLDTSLRSGETVRRGWRSSVATVGWVWHHRMGPRGGPGEVLLSQGWWMGSGKYGGVQWIYCRMKRRETPHRVESSFYIHFCLFDVYDTCMIEIQNRSSQKQGILSLSVRSLGALKFTGPSICHSNDPQVWKWKKTLAEKISKKYGIRFCSISRRYYGWR